MNNQSGVVCSIEHGSRKMGILKPLIKTAKKGFGLKIKKTKKPKKPKK